jgi:hypothetical protein
METKNHKELNLIILFKQTTLKAKQSYKQQTTTSSWEEEEEGWGK